MIAFLEKGNNTFYVDSNVLHHRPWAKKWLSIVKEERRWGVVSHCTRTKLERDHHKTADSSSYARAHATCFDNILHALLVLRIFLQNSKSRIHNKYFFSFFLEMRNIGNACTLLVCVLYVFHLCLMEWSHWRKYAAYFCTTTKRNLKLTPMKTFCKNSNFFYWGRF